jgi:hypothetical protein
MHNQNYLKIVFGIILIIISFQKNSIAGCSSEIRILGDDLIGKKFTPQENHLLSERILRAKQHCFRGDEEKSLDAINAARDLAGLKPATGTFDWETVPIEDLNRQPRH